MHLWYRYSFSCRFHALYH